MSRTVRRIRKRENIKNSKFKTILIILTIILCLFVIYKYNFTTKSEIQITTPVRFKEYDGSNMLSANIELLEDEKGKYIILPDKVNGFFTKAYYLSEENDDKNLENDEKVLNTVNENITVENTNTENSTIENTTVVDNTTVGNTAVENVTSSVENNVINNETVSENANKVENETVLPAENATEEKEETVDDENEKNNTEKTIQEQIEELNQTESLFAQATESAEEYADKLEAIAQSMDDNTENKAENNEDNEISNVDTELENNETKQENSNNEKLETNIEPEKTVPVQDTIPEFVNEVITEKRETLPGEKYYLSEEELENEDLEIIVEFQKIEINGETLYNQELVSDMIDTVIKLTCYTPFGYYLDVKSQDVNEIEELKGDVESLANSEILFAYDIKITNGQKEYQPEEYYQVATVSVNKPEVIDYKINSQSLQLLHIKEDAEVIDFQKVNMSKIENDEFEFLTDEFSTYALILYAADQGDKLIINDYLEDKYYYIGKNYTDDMSGENSGKYTDDNLAEVNINYYSYNPDINLNVEKSYTVSNFGWSFGSKSYSGGVTKYTASIQIPKQTGKYLDFNKPWNINITIPSSQEDIFEEYFTSTSTTGVTCTYDEDTNILTLSGNNLNNWTNETDGTNYATSSISLSVVLNFSGDITVTLSNPTRTFEGIERNIFGTTSYNEQHVLYSYSKCLPIESGKVVAELIDNPFINRPVGFGFNGWLSKDANTSITTNSSTFVQTLTRTLTAEELSSKTVTINVYVNWTEARIVFVNTSAGNDSNNGRTTDKAVKSWTGVNNKMNKLTTTTASSRELNFVVFINGELATTNSNTPNFAYTLTSVYGGIDYRGSALYNVNANITINYDRQIEYIKTYSTKVYTGNTNDGNDAISNYLCGNGKNLRIGRGLYSARSTNTTKYTDFAQVFGMVSSISKDYRLVIESGYYASVHVFKPYLSASATIKSCATLVLGSDIDRVNNNNEDLKVHYRVTATTSSETISPSTTNLPASLMICKSGTFGMDAFNYHYGRGNSDYTYTGIYVGGLRFSSSPFTGDRNIIVEGGKISNIIGGLKLNSYNSVKTRIYVKNGDVLNIVGGAGQSATYGDRIIQVTGGLIEYSVAGGSNGAFSTSSASGELNGSSLVYIGGNATIGSATNNLYSVAPGTVSGAGNGIAGIANAGRVNTSHIIIDKEATINNNVYGGGNYGYVRPDASVSVPADGEYILANGSSITTSTSYLYYSSDTRIGYKAFNNSAQDLYWTIEMSGSSFYIKRGNNYLVAPNANSNNMSYTTNKADATLFSYNSNRRITYTIGRTTRYLRFNSSNLYTNSNSSYSTAIYFIKVSNATRIDILGGTIKNNVFGGANQSKIVGSVDINMYGGTINGAIYGGSNTSGDIFGDADISIEGGKIGNSKNQDSVFGGGYGASTNIGKNSILTIKDTKDNINILGNIYGGSSLGNIRGTTTVNIEDHYLEGKDGKTVNISGNVFGGGKGTSSGSGQTSYGNVTVNIDGGTYENLDVYGGYNTSGIVSNGKIEVNIGKNYNTKINDVYGGGNDAYVGNGTTGVDVKMYSKATVKNAYNGGNNAYIHNVVPIGIYAMGANVTNLFGGSNNSGSIAHTNVQVSDKAEVTNVFGGGNKAEITSSSASVNVYTSVNITGESEVGTVYGGGKDAAVKLVTNGTNGSTNVTIENSTIGNVFGGGKGQTATVAKDTNIELLDATISECVYGGGDLGAVTGKTNVTSTRSNIHNSVFGGGNEAQVSGGTLVNISQSTISNSIFGGGNDANVSKGTLVNIMGSTAKNAYGGGMNGNVTDGTNVKVLEESTIYNNVFGGGSKGNVVGWSYATIDNSRVQNDVFGGGEIAEVTRTQVILQNNAEVENVYGGGDNGVTTETSNVKISSSKVNQSAFGAGNGTPAIVKQKSYIVAEGNTVIGKSLFAGGNNAQTGLTTNNPNNPAVYSTKPLAKASAVADIAGAIIGENLYGGANTSVIYGDTAVNVGTEAIKSYYRSINNATIPNYTVGKINIAGTVYGGGEQMDPTKEYNFDTVSVEGYIQINVDATGYNTSTLSLDIKDSIFGSGHASRAGIPEEYISDPELLTQVKGGYLTINGDVGIKAYGTVTAPKAMISVQRCSNVVLDKSSLWMSGATDSTNNHATTYFSFNRIEALKLKNSSTLYLRSGANLLESFYSMADDNRGNEVKAKVEITNEITGANGKKYDAIGNYVYNLNKEIRYVVMSGQIFKADSTGTPLELETDVVSSRTKSVTKNADNRVYMYSGLNLNISNDENLSDDSWGPVKGMTFFGIFNTTNSDPSIDPTQTSDTNSDISTINTGMYSVNYDTTTGNPLKWNERNFNCCYVEGEHVTYPEEQNIEEDGFYTNFERFEVEYGEDEEIEEATFDAHIPTSYTDYITPTPDNTKFYMWYAGPDQSFFYYNLALVASKLSTYGTIEKSLQGISFSNATFKITGVESSLINGATLCNKGLITNINTTGNPNKEFALAMKTGGTGWNMNGETNFLTTPAVDYTGTTTYKTENLNTTPSLGFYLYHSNNITEEAELGYFTINMVVYYWKTSTQQGKARVTIDVAIATRVYEDLGYDASITPGRQYEIFPRTLTNITTKSSFSAYFQLHEKEFSENRELQSFFSHKEYPDPSDPEGEDVVDNDLIQDFINTNYRLVRSDYAFPENTTITMIDRSTDNPTYYYYTVTNTDVINSKKEFRLSEFRKMGSTEGYTSTGNAEYYLDSNRSTYVTTVEENGSQVTYQSECFIFIVDFESANFENPTDRYEIIKDQSFQLILTSDVTNRDGEKLEVGILEEYKESNSISFSIYDTESVIEIDATISPNKIYVGDSSNIDIETNYSTIRKDPSNTTTVFDTRYFSSKLGVKITIFDEAGDIVHGANLLGAYFKIVESDGTVSQYYPRTDGTTRIKIADKVSNSKASITFETAKSTIPTGKYTFLIESFGSADGVYFGIESSASTTLTLNIINDEFGLTATVPSNYVIIDKLTGYTTEDTTGFTVEKEYEILDEDGNVIGPTTEELNDGKNDFEYSVQYSSGYENPYISVALYRRNYEDVYDKTYSLVDLSDYFDITLNPVPDNIKEQYEIITYDSSGNEIKKYAGYEAYGIDFINEAVRNAVTSSETRPVIRLTTKCALKENLVSGTYKLVFTLYDKSEVEKIIEIENEDGTLTAEPQIVTEYQRIGEAYAYIIIK